MFPTLQLGPLAVPLAPISILIMFWLGTSLAEKFAPNRGISADTLYNLIFTGLSSGLIAARIGYIVQYPGAFIQSPLSMFSLNPSLLDPFSAFAAALIGMLIYGQRNKMRLWNTLDAITPLLAMLAIGLALSHIASGEAFGIETTTAWGIELWGAKRHPSQIYELIGAVSILVFLGWISKKNISRGALFLSFVGLQAGASLFLEAFRGDSSLIWGGFRITQILAWIILVFVFLGLEWLKTNPENENKEVQRG